MKLSHKIIDKLEKEYHIFASNRIIYDFCDGFGSGVFTINNSKKFHFTTIADSPSQLFRAFLLSELNPNQSPEILAPIEGSHSEITQNEKPFVDLTHQVFFKSHPSEKASLPRFFAIGSSWIKWLKIAKTNNVEISHLKYIIGENEKYHFIHKIIKNSLMKTTI